MTSNTSSHNRPIRIDHSAGIDTLLSRTSEALISSIVPQAPFEIVDPPLHQSIRICKSTKLLDFAYSCYSSSFTSFLTSLYCLYEPSSYKETIPNPFLQQAMNEELSALHKTNT